MLLPFSYNPNCHVYFTLCKLHLSYYIESVDRLAWNGSSRLGYPGRHSTRNSIRRSRPSPAFPHGSPASPDQDQPSGPESGTPSRRMSALSGSLPTCGYRRMPSCLAPAGRVA